ncbi:MAG: ABC transporter substrate-binding protein [Sulfolobales archaeon]
MTQDLVWRIGLGRLSLIALVLVLIVVGIASLYLYNIMLSKPQISETTRARIPVQKITIITTTEAEDPVRWAAVQAMASEWRKLGFDVEVIGMESSQVDKTCYYEWNFDVCVFGWGARVDRLDPNLFLGLITTGEIGIKGSGANNPTGYSNPEYDRLYELQRETMDLNKRREIVFQLQQIFFEEAPRYNLYHQFIIAAYNNQKWENPFQMPGAPLFNEWQPYFITPVKGEKQDLIYGSNTEPDILNPAVSTLIFSWNILKLVYDSLVRLGPDGRIIPWLAESINVVNNTVVDVRIRNNARFHDGTPITADDVVFTYNYYIRIQYAYFRPYYVNIQEVIKLDNYTIRFILKKPDATFLTNTLYMIPILPKHVWENITDPRSLTPEQLDKVLRVGSGPFKNPVWVKKEYISLEAAPEHFAYNGIVIGNFTVPPMKVSKLIIRIYGSLDGIVNALINREIDMTAVGLLPSHADLLKKYNYITVVTARSFALPADLMFNVRRSPFDLKEVRQALLYAVPYDYIINVILRGYGEKGYIIAPVNAFWHNPDVPTYEYNLTKARELLAKAGFTWDESGRIYYPENYTIKKQEDP